MIGMKWNVDLIASILVVMRHADGVCSSSDNVGEDHVVKDVVLGFAVHGATI